MKSLSKRITEALNENLNTDIKKQLDMLHDSKLSKDIFGIVTSVLKHKSNHVTAIFGKNRQDNNSIHISFFTDKDIANNDRGVLHYQKFMVSMSMHIVLGQSIGRKFAVRSIKIVYNEGQSARSKDFESKYDWDNVNKIATYYEFSDVQRNELLNFCQTIMSSTELITSKSDKFSNLLSKYDKNGQTFTETDRTHSYVVYTAKGLLGRNSDSPVDYISAQNAESLGKQLTNSTNLKYSVQPQEKGYITITIS